MILLQFVWTNFASWFEPFERFNRDSNSFWNLVAIQVSALSQLISTKVDGSNSVRFNSHRLGVHALRLPVICWRHSRRMRVRKCCFVMKKWCWVRSRVRVHALFDELYTFSSLVINCVFVFVAHSLKKYKSLGARALVVRQKSLHTYFRETWCARISYLSARA